MGETHRLSSTRTTDRAALQCSSAASCAVAARARTMPLVCQSRVGMPSIPVEVLDLVLDASLSDCLASARSEDVARTRALAWFRCVAPVCSAFAETARLLLYATIEVAIGRAVPLSQLHRVRRAAVLPHWRWIVSSSATDQ